MITLHGTPISNYYNKVKLALLEKGIAFDEAFVPPGSTEEQALLRSPLGKVPFISTPHGPVCESQAILDYLELLQPQPALLPSDPYAAAKVKELCHFMDLNVELAVRPLYGQAFFGGKASAEVQDRARKLLMKSLPAFKRLARFAPYAAGEEFTQADCCAWVTLPLVGMATQNIYGENLLLTAGLDIAPYMKLVGERASAQRVVADRKVAQKALIEQARPAGQPYG